METIETPREVRVITLERMGRSLKKKSHVTLYCYFFKIVWLKMPILLRTVILVRTLMDRHFSENGHRRR
jgi:hypothetical protein